MAKVKVNHFQVNVPFLYPLKASEIRGYSGVSRVYRNVTLVRNALKMTQRRKLKWLCHFYPRNSAYLSKVPTGDFKDAFGCWKVNTER